MCGFPESAPAANEMVKLGPEVVPIVIATLQDHNEQVVAMAIRACGRFRGPAVTKALVRCIRDANCKPLFTPTFADCEVQYWCMDSLAELGPEAYGPLLEVSKECQSDLRAELPRRLAHRWGAKAVPHLIEMLEDSDVDFRNRAIEELGKFKDKRATEILVRLMNVNVSENDTSGDSGAAAAAALRDIGDPKAIPGLLKVLRNMNYFEVERATRIIAAGALARMGQDEGRNFLLASVKSKDRDDRAIAATELGTIQIKGTLGPLLSLLDDNDSSVRSSAECALGELHDSAAIPALKKLLNDPDRTVCVCARLALEKLVVKPPPTSQPLRP